MNKSKTRILYIEDDAGLARLLERRLQRHGYELEWAADGSTGLERMQQEAFDVVAIDYEMPGLNGLAVLESMQELEDPPPAIMISGAGDMDTVIAAMKVGAADYVVKTIDGGYLELLPSTIEQVLEKERLQAQADAAQRALEEKTELLSLTLSSINQGLSVFDGNLCLLAWNERWFELFKYPPTLAVVGTSHEAFVQFCSRYDPENLEMNIAKKMPQIRDGVVQTSEYRLHDGTVIEACSSPMPNGGVVTVYTDITSRKQAEEEQRVAAAVFRDSAEPMLITDAKVCVERCNPAFEALFGYTSDELVGRNPNIFSSGKHDAGFYENLWKNLGSTGHWRGIIWNRHKYGTLLAQQVTISAICDNRDKVENYVAVYTDVTEHLRREDEARHRALHDQLTGLPNRSLLQDRIAHAIEAAQRDGKGFAVCFIDLDGFKPINDDFGHGTGDLLLKEIARRLSARCRSSDTVARYGGDEFVVLLRNTGEVDVIAAIAHSLIRKIARPMNIGNVAHEVQASVGVALYPGDALSVTELLKKADQAMYRAKNAGKAQYRFYSEPDFNTRSG